MVPVLSWSSSCGLASALGTPNCVNEGPAARMSTLFGELPCTMKPAIITLARVPTFSRVEIFPEGSVPLRVPRKAEWMALCANMVEIAGGALMPKIVDGEELPVSKLPFKKTQASGVAVGVGVDVGVAVGGGVGVGVGVPVGLTRKAFRTDSAMLSEAFW